MTIEAFKSAIAAGISHGNKFRVRIPGLSEEECMMCADVNISPVTFNTYNWRRTSRTPALRLPFDLIFEPLTMEFYMRKDGSPFKQLEAWKKEVYTDDFRFNDFDQYAQGRDIVVQALDSKDSVMITATYYNCFPLVVGPLPYSYSAHGPQKFGVNFAYEFMKTD